MLFHYRPLATAGITDTLADGGENSFVYTLVVSGLTANDTLTITGDATDEDANTGNDSVRVSAVGVNATGGDPGGTLIMVE